MNGNTCSTDCPDGYYKNIDTDYCDKCDIRCAVCKKSGNDGCFKCNKGLFLKDLSCKEFCPSKK